jgi:hypothetical protein
VYWETVKEEYIKNIDENIIKDTLNSSLLKYNNKKEFFPIENKNMLFTKGGVLNESIDLCNNVNVFADNIANNLESITKRNEADKLSNYIIGILASGLIPLICGYRSREIAAAISIAYCGEIPYIITLPNGYNNANELINQCTKSKFNTILIEDGIGSMNENTLLPIFREMLNVKCSNKLLFLSTEDTELLKYMPKNLYNYVALVNINCYLLDKDTDFICCDSKAVLKKFIANIDYSEDYKKVKNILKSLKLDSLYVLLRSNIINYTSKLSNLKEAVECYIKSELKLLCEHGNLYEQFEKNILSSEIGGCNYKDVILDILKGENNE